MSLDSIPSERERSLIKQVKNHSLYPMAKVILHPEFEQFFLTYFQSWEKTEVMIHYIRAVYRFKKFLEHEHHKINNEYQLWGFIAQYTDTTQKRKVLTRWMKQVLDTCDKKDWEKKGQELVKYHPEKQNTFNTLAHPEFYEFFQRYFGTEECDQEMVMFILTMLELKKRFQLTTPEEITRGMIGMIHNPEYRKIMVQFMTQWMSQTPNSTPFTNVLIK